MAIDTNKVQQQAAELSSQLWSICNDLRGGMDANEFRNYILGTIFYRYLSERTEMYMQDILKEDGLSYEEAFTNPEFRRVLFRSFATEHGIQYGTLREIMTEYVFSGNISDEAIRQHLKDYHFGLLKITKLTEETRAFAAETYKKYKAEGD